MTGTMKKSVKQNQADLSNEVSVSSIESSPSTTPVHVVNDMSSQYMSHNFNSIDIQSPTNRNLSEKELRDCDVIGMYLFYKIWLLLMINTVD